MQTATDEELIRAAQAGDTECYTLLVRRYEHRLFRSIARIVSSKEDAEDLCQETFTRAWKALAGFRQEAMFYSWVFRIALNLRHSMKRKRVVKGQSIEARRELAGDDLPDQHPEMDPSFSMIVEDQQRLVQEILAEMDESFRTVLVLTDIDGLSYEEISQTISCPIGTVRSRIHRARQEFRMRVERRNKREQIA